MLSCVQRWTTSDYQRLLAHADTVATATTTTKFAAADRGGATALMNYIQRRIPYLGECELGFARPDEGCWDVPLVNKKNVWTGKIPNSADIGLILV